MAIQAIGDFFKHQSDKILEGGFWGAWCGLSVYNWTSALKRKEGASQLPESTQKAEKIYKANKEVFTTSCSMVSGISMIFSWTCQVGIITLGAVAPYLNSLGFVGSGITSSVKAWDTWSELNRGVEAYYRVKDPVVKDEIALDQLKNILKIAFFTCLAGWGVLGAAHALIGGAELFAIVDSLFYYSVVLFFGNLAAIIVFSTPKEQCYHNTAKA
ncbi:MAG: hypothetical protein K1000chlam2_01317 [Chlamydiae bacterium]|nr:hypothetical protein [Chlamydiota bacterium]